MEAALGELFAPMLECMSSRGPDSAGLAVYRDPVPEGWLKFSLQHDDATFEWSDLAARLGTYFQTNTRLHCVSTHATIALEAAESQVRKYLREQVPGITLMSVGRSVEIIKEVGLPRDVIARFRVSEMTGTHAIGHTRMATESAVTTNGSHPFSTGPDLCLVHNGSLSNHNRVRNRLRKEGITFDSDNDSEVAAGYLTWRLQRGEDLQTALHSALQDLDGFYTFAIGTRDGFAVLRDRVACKPAVLAETDDYVAMASEFRSLADLPGIAHARLWEPEPATVYTWSRASRTSASASITSN